MPARDSGPSAQRAREISQGPEELPARNALVRPVAAVSDLDQALLGQEIPHSDANRHAEEVRVLELHAGALVAIVEQHVETRRSKLAVDLLAGTRLRAVLGPDRDQVHLERCNGPGPDDAIRVVALLDRPGSDPGGANPIRSHDDRLLLPLLVQVHRTKRRGVPRPELED